jgi:hypothetical protein
MFFSLSCEGLWYEIIEKDDFVCYSMKFVMDAVAMTYKCDVDALQAKLPN